MKYNPPFGSTDPDASYVDKNVPGAVRGSSVPAEAIEYPQREIVDLIIKSGFDPDEVLQLAVAIQSGKVNFATAGGTANAMTATLSPAPPALTPGMRLWLLSGTANTTTTPTLNVNGFGASGIVGNDGSALPLNAFVPGLIAPLIWDGTRWRMETFTTLQTPPRNIVSYTTAGTTNFTVPAGVFKIFARVWAGGGGGGGNSASTNAGGGGGGGGYTEGWFDVTPGQVIPVTVGAGGAAGAASSSGVAGTGGSSSVGALCSATGGVGGGNGTGTGGVAGSGTGGTFSRIGGNGYAGGYIAGNTSLPFGGAGAPSYQQSLVMPALGGGSVGGFGPGVGGSGTSGAGGVGGLGAAGMVIIQY